MKNNYPVILLPTFYMGILESKLPTSDPPIEPVVPIKPIMPNKPKNKGCLIIVIIFFISGFFYFIISGVGAVNIIWVIGSIIILFMFSRANNEDKKEYEENLEKYKSDIAKYNDDLRHYATRREEFVKALESYNRQIQKYNSTEFIRNNRIQLFKACESKTIKPKENLYIIKKGASEDYFFKFLQKYFGDHISQNKTLEINGSQYFPDYTYSDEAKNLYIDIEIDEPYCGSDGTPIHFIGSKDDKRDNFFGFYGWFVIRFTEEQIIKQPDECCLFVNSVIKSSMIVSPIDEDQLISFCNLEIIPRWSKEEAYKLAYRRFRNSYLPKELALNMGGESNEEYSEDFPIIEDLPF